MAFSHLFKRFNTGVHDVLYNSKVQVVGLFVIKIKTSLKNKRKKVRKYVQ